jgi:hypothetical protein
MMTVARKLSFLSFFLSLYLSQTHTHTHTNTLSFSLKSTNTHSLECHYQAPIRVNVFPSSMTLFGPFIFNIKIRNFGRKRLLFYQMISFNNFSVKTLVVVYSLVIKWPQGFIFHFTLQPKTEKLKNIISPWSFASRTTAKLF